MIVYDGSTQTLTLQTRRSTYQMKVDAYGVLLHTYYGRKVQSGDMSNLIDQEDRGFSPNPDEADGGKKRNYSLDSLPQELASNGVGDFRLSSLELETEDGCYAADFRYVKHEIRDGKYALEGLPAFYDTPEAPAQTLVVTMQDRVAHVEVDLLYGVQEETDLITRALIVKNVGTRPVRLRRVMSLCLDFPNADYDFLTLSGAYGRERLLSRQAIRPGRQSVGSTRGSSSHQHNPFVVLCQHETTEEFGECVGAALLYSGNFLASVEYTQLEHTRLVMGIHPYRFCFSIAPGEHFSAPEVALIYSDQGLTGMSQRFHRVIRKHLCRGVWKDRARPILINSWEAAMFQFDEEKILSIARKAAQAGMEMLVLDDGWFSNRNNDLSGLGDWEVDKTKFPDGLGPLSQKIEDLGMRFGLWIEPEMMSENSELYRKHPDWAFQIPNRPPTRGRSQLALDLTRPEVQEYIRTWMDKLLRSAKISYLKWDMNRSLSDVWSHACSPEQQGEVYHRYILGLYALLEWLYQSFPHLLIESCAGGGGRFDCGMLYYTPQIWCSDNTDAIDRLQMQYGTSFCYPACTVGAHVSATPNSMTGRNVSMYTRGIVAASGTFGYELDLNELEKADWKEVCRQIKQYKAEREIFLFGEHYRLSSPMGDAFYAANEYVTPDRTCALVSIVQMNVHANPVCPVIRLKGLDPDGVYQFEGGTFRGDQLMYAGIPCPKMQEYQAVQLHFKRTDR